jgi:hypothetical protein
MRGSWPGSRRSSASTRSSPRTSWRVTSAARVEVTDGTVHLVLFILDYDGPSAVAREIDLVLGDGVLGMSEAGSAFAGAEAGGFWTVTATIVAITVFAAVILRRIDWI